MAKKKVENHLVYAITTNERTIEKEVIENNQVRAITKILKEIEKDLEYFETIQSIKLIRAFLITF